MILIINEETELADGWSAFPSSYEDMLYLYADSFYQGIVRYRKNGTYTLSSRISKMPKSIHKILRKYGKVYVRLVKLSAMQ